MLNPKVDPPPRRMEPTQLRVRAEHGAGYGGVDYGAVVALDLTHTELAACRRLAGSWRRLEEGGERGIGAQTW